MALPATRDLIRLARQAGYQVVATEHPRPNRWVLTLADPAGSTIGLLVQARPLIGAADVHDLADLIQLRRLDSGILLAYNGQFGPGAYQAQAERSDTRIQLCSTLPPAATPDPSATLAGSAIQSGAFVSKG